MTNDVVFKCALCPNSFEDELSLNTHTLFDHGSYREKCTTDVKAKKDFRAEQLKIEINTLKK